MSGTVGDDAPKVRRGLPRRPGEAAALRVVSAALAPVADPPVTAPPGTGPLAPAKVDPPAGTADLPSADVPPVDRPSTPVRRGLPRRPQDAVAAAPVAASPAAPVAAALPTPAPASVPAPVAAPATAPAARQGLPRTAAHAAAQVTPPAPGATPAPAPDRANPDAGGSPQATPAAAAPGRRGLPRPGRALDRATAVAGMPPAASAASVPPAAPEASAPAAPEASQPAARHRSWMPLSRRQRIGVAVAALLVVAVGVVFLARWVSGLGPVAQFLADYNGTAALPSTAPVGLPAWVGWQHFLNAFFIVLIIRTGWQVRTQQRPPAMWVRNNEGRIRTKNPPKRISLTLWTHQALDVLWLVNGAVFVVLLFVTGQWMRIVPTSWDIVPNAASAALRYMSFDWPTENGWVNYNALQTLAYFATTFVAAPLAAITGARMSGIWPQGAKRLNRLYPIELARALHFPVMLYFVLFVIVHVVLVFATGALRNLNHMYGGADVTSWFGAGIFAVSLVVMAAAVWAARPLVVAPVAQLMGRVGR